MKGPLQQQKAVKNLLPGQILKENNQGIKNMSFETRLKSLEELLSNEEVKDIHKKMDDIIPLLQSLNQTKYSQQNSPDIAKMLKFIMNLLVRFQKRCTSEHIRSIVYLLMSKITRSNFHKLLKSGEKIQVIKNWNFNNIDENIQQSNLAISTFIIQQASLQNLQQVLILLYFMVQSKAKIQDSTLFAVNWLIRNSIRAFKDSSLHQSKLIIFLVKYFVNKIQSLNLANRLALKTYANFLIILLHSMEEKEQIKQIQHHFKTFNLIECLYTLQLEGQSIKETGKCTIGEEKQDLFLQLVVLFIKTNEQVLKKIIKFIISINGTPVMISNCLYLFNTENGQFISQIDRIDRASSVLQIFQEAYKQQPKKCIFSKKGSWIYKLVQKKSVGLVLLKMQINHPLLKNGQKQLLLKVQFQKGIFNLVIRFNQQKNPGFKLTLKRQGKTSQQSKDLQQLAMHKFQSVLINISIQFKSDNRVSIYGEEIKMFDINNASLGRPKAILLGNREQQSSICGIKKIYSMYVIQDISMGQYLKQKMSLEAQTNNARLKRTLSLQDQKSIKINIIDEIENPKQKKVFQKLRISSKSLTFGNIQIRNVKNYREVMQQFKGKQRLISYLLNALEAINNDIVLRAYTKFIRKQLSNLYLNQNNFYEILFIHGFSIFLRKPLNIINQISDIVLQMNKQAFKNKKISNTRMIYLIQMKLNLFLSMKQQQQSHKLITFFEYFLKKTIMQSTQKGYIVCRKISENLNYSLWNCINDNILQNEMKQNTVQSIFLQADKFGSITNDQEEYISNYNNTLQLLQTKKDFKYFPGTVRKILNIIVNNCSNDTFLFGQFVSYLNLVLVILSGLSLSGGKRFKINQLIIVLQQIYTIFIDLSIQFAKMKQLPEENQKTICSLLSQLYNILPTISILCKVSIRQQGDSQENFYKIYTSTQQRQYNLKFNQAFGLISKFYNICFQIGSFCLKGRKNGFLSYMDYALRFLNQYKEELQWSESTDVLTYKDRIALTEIYASCWKFVVGNSRSKSLTKNYDLDKETRIELADRLNELNFGLYCPYPLNQQNNRNVIQQIIQLHILQNIQEKLPSYILANIGPQDLQHILEQIKQNIDKNKKFQKDQRLRLYLQMIEIINQYQRPIILQFQSDQFKKLPDFNKKTQLIFKWYEIYKRIKKIHQLYIKSLQQNYSNNHQITNQFQTSLRQPFIRVLQKLGDQKTFQKITIIINNFVFDNNGQIGKNSFEAMDQDKNLYVFKLLKKECLEVNSQMFTQKRKRLKRMDSLKIGLKSNEPNIFFMTERSQIQKENLSENQKKNIKLVSQKVAKRILLNNRVYFMEMHTKLSTDKTNVLNGYYDIIERLSSEEKIINWGKSKKYDYYNYYILDDYVSQQNIKLMLKRDNVLVFSSMIFGQIPRLVQSKLQLQSKSITYAITIAKNLFDLNSNKFFEFVNQKIKVYEPNKMVKQKGREKTTSIKLNAYLITKSKIYQGRIQIKGQFIEFYQNNYIDQNIYRQFYANHSQKRTYQEIAVSKKALKIQISTIKYSHPKKYLQKYYSLQVYANSLSYFFVFDNKQDREKFLNYSKIQNRTSSDNIQYINQLCQAWEKRWISNFEYLMTINNIAGRSLNDVSQYYVFPWTVKNFNGIMDQNFMKTKSNFRELNKSIGSINPKKLQLILNKYANSIVQLDISQKPYMFGGFYSNSAIVCNYLLRVNPFTVHHYQLQGKHFDLYDRLFTNMQSQFDSVFNNTMDNRQLLPQFYSAPEFFRNRNRYNFSYNPKKEKIDLKMNMPEWVVTKSPEQFVLKMRKVLQSDATSQRLGEWIDMIFGKKSQIQCAAQNHNLYVHYLYKTKQTTQQRQLTRSQKQDLETQTQTKAHMIKQFGQVPKNIFGNKLSPKMGNRQFKQSIVVAQKYKLEVIEQNNKNQDSPIIFDFNDCVLVVCHKNLLTIINTTQDPSKSRYQQVMQEQIIRVSVSSIKKTKFILIFVITVSGKMLFLSAKRNMKGTLFINKKQEFKIDKRIDMFPSIKFRNVKIVSNYVILSQQNILRILKITKEYDKEKSNNILFELVQDQKTDERRLFYDLGTIYLHRSNIVYLEVYPCSEIIVSVDQSGFINTFSLVPQLTIRGTFLLTELKASESVTKIIIHSIGLLVILTNLRQLMVYNIYGDLIQKVKFQVGISDIAFWDSKSSSEILVSTKNGEIHQIDLFQMIKPGEDCLEGKTVSLPSKPNSVIKVNQKQNNKLIIDRFGKYWSVYVLCSVHQNYIYLSQKQFYRIYNTKKFLRCCNQNNSYRNS